MRQLAGAGKRLVLAAGGRYGRHYRRNRRTT
jgi:hypothetical protein